MYGMIKFNFILLIALFNITLVFAAGGKVTDPTGAAPDRYVYYPGTEDLAKDEIRLFV